jgi:hypothetical protein
MINKSRLLRETAEIALTEIKRFVEPRLREDLSLRRVSAPLYLPVGSPLLSPLTPGAHVTLPVASREVEIVGSLDLWLRDQLKQNDIAPGFGVFTIMNALRPDLPENSTSTPHVVSWAWQQTANPASCSAQGVLAVARKAHKILLDAEAMVLSLFPHISATLSKELVEITTEQLAELHPGSTAEQSIYDHLHPANTDDNALQPLLFVWRNRPGCNAFGEMWAWNNMINRPIMLADFGAWPADSISFNSIGGNIYRHYVGLQLLHQDRLMV